LSNPLTGLSRRGTTFPEWYISTGCFMPFYTSCEEAGQKCHVSDWMWITPGTNRGCRNTPKILSPAGAIQLVYIRRITCLAYVSLYY
jgi:hypothetical protein